MRSCPGNVINDAVAERNNLIEQQYGLKIEVESAQYPSEEIKNYFLTGDAKYDLVCESVDRMVTQISENLLLVAGRSAESRRPVVGPAVGGYPFAGRREAFLRLGRRDAHER